MSAVPHIAGIFWKMRMDHLTSWWCSKFASSSAGGSPAPEGRGTRWQLSSPAINRRFCREERIQNILPSYRRIWFLHQHATSHGEALGVVSFDQFLTISQYLEVCRQVCRVSRARPCSPRNTSLHNWCPWWHFLLRCLQKWMSRSVFPGPLSLSPRGAVPPDPILHGKTRSFSEARGRASTELVGESS